MADDPAVEAAARELAQQDLGSMDWHRWRPVAQDVVAVVRAAIVEECAQAVEAETADDDCECFRCETLHVAARVVRALAGPHG